MSISIRVNGERREVVSGSSVGALLAQLALDPATILVELNRKVLARESCAATPLQAEDCLEIIRFVRGG